ncbi:MAG: DNA recombination protein RmuC [Holophagae bacterium]|nr:DNA recombination protein RmuC [Holophagae bacterium]
MDSSSLTALIAAASLLVGVFGAVLALLPRIRHLNRETTRLNNELREESNRRIAAETELESERKNTAEKFKMLEDAEKKLSDSFRALSSSALESNNESFLRLAKSVLEGIQKEASGDLALKQKAIQTLVEPLSDSLKQVNQQISELEKKRVSDFTSMESYLTSLKESQERLRGETANLVTALRKPQVRGRWGEIQLRNVVEFAGMETHCDFAEQASVPGEDGLLRPDMIVHLPGNKQMIVDSKAPLDAYLEAIEAKDVEEKKGHMARHAAQVREHINKLSGKQYWNQFENTPEFVVLFLPGENFFSAALEQDPKIFEYAIDKRVLLATPTTLIALLKSAHYGWQQAHLGENAQRISQLGKELYDRIRTLAMHFVSMKKSLDRTVETYNKAVGSLEGRVLVTARRFKELGATSGEEIPPVEPVNSISRGLNAPDSSTEDNE